MTRVGGCSACPAPLVSTDQRASAHAAFTGTATLTSHLHRRPAPVLSYISGRAHIAFQGSGRALPIAPPVRCAPLVRPWGAALTVGTHTARSCHSVLLLLGRPPATTAQLRPIAAPRLIPRAPLASGSVAPDAAAPRGSTPLRSGRPRAILDPVITDWSCAPRGRSLGCPRLPHGGADGSRPEKLAPRGGCRGGWRRARRASARPRPIFPL